MLSRQHFSDHHRKPHRQNLLHVLRDTWDGHGRNGGKEMVIDGRSNYEGWERFSVDCPQL